MWVRGDSERGEQYALITGGAGFIGTNVALSYLEQNRRVHIFDNLARSAVKKTWRNSGSVIRES